MDAFAAYPSAQPLPQKQPADQPVAVLASSTAPMVLKDDENLMADGIHLFGGTDDDSMEDDVQAEPAAIALPDHAIQQTYVTDMQGAVRIDTVEAPTPKAFLLPGRQATEGDDDKASRLQTGALPVMWATSATDVHQHKFHHLQYPPPWDVAAIRTRDPFVYADA